MMPAKLNSNRVSLKYLLDGMVNVDDIFIAKPSVDARKVVEGGLFLAVNGLQTHGLVHAEQAIIAGAIAIVYDPDGGAELLLEKIRKQHDISLIALPDLNANISKIAARFYQFPSRNMTVIGVTGTNGKTSISHFIAQALSAVDYSCGVMGTLGWGRFDNLKKAMNTTPDAVSVQQQVASLLDGDFAAVAMEVSSHGLHQCRVSAVEYKGAVFTNLSHDHLDYHETMDEYGEAKSALFKCASLEFAVLNIDDEFSGKIEKVLLPDVKQLNFSRTKASASKENCLFIHNEQLGVSGLSFDVSLAGRVAHVQSGLFGVFNVDNLVATMATMISLGYTLEKAALSVQKITSVRGRMHVISAVKFMPTVIVDYAHTPDALRLALSSLREHCAGRLTLVFGCGGDRDEAKRPLMGCVATELADEVIITNDNPRFESAEKIIAQIQTGIVGSAKVSVVLDRKQAIEKAIEQSNSTDIVLIAGKGHEGYQHIGAEKITFSDITEVENVLNLRVEVDVCKS